jgi:hypothetical protein
MKELLLVFLIQLKKCTVKLSSNPRQFAIKYDDIRCMPVEKFPFLFHYRIDEAKRTVKVEAHFIQVEILMSGINDPGNNLLFKISYMP